MTINWFSLAGLSGSRGAQLLQLFVQSCSKLVTVAVVGLSSLSTLSVGHSYLHKAAQS